MVCTQFGMHGGYIFLSRRVVMDGEGMLSSVYCEESLTERQGSVNFIH